MFDDLRLTELHEEWAWKPYMRGFEEEVDALDAEIRRRVAAQEIRFRWAVDNGAMGLLYGVPDAEREYPRRRSGVRRTGPGVDMWSGASFESWVNHAAHYIPVEGCHLCREGGR